MRILMVSTEYPPIRGGVGRYTENLTNSLSKIGLDVIVASDERGKSDFGGLTPLNKANSEILLGIVREASPDIVHIQFEPGMYGLYIDPKGLRCSGTYIDSFYERCKIPIVTTFHSTYNLHDWISQANLVKRHGKIGSFGIPLRFLIRFWKYLMSYQSYNTLNRKKLKRSKAGIVFSKYMSHAIGGGKVIYHGAEPTTPTISISKREARLKLALPDEGRIALALGFRTRAKGWDLLQNMKLPKNWTLVVNSSKGSYNKEEFEFKWPTQDNNIIDLQMGFLSDQQLSLIFFAADAVLLPYRVIAASGVMFDALAHGVPFVSSDLKFFKEFAEQGLGITVRRSPQEFSDALRQLDKNYSSLVESVTEFKSKLKWDFVAREHESVYCPIFEKEKNKR
jgi:glycosyltransferase involved in cell wall biosynthesis